MMLDPFTEAFRSPDLMEKLAANPATRAHLADPGFLKQLEKVRALASDPSLEGASFEKTSAVSQQISRIAFNDPRLMQVVMALTGTNLTVEDKDLKHAEEVGDMPRREPVQLEQLLLARDVTDPDEAKRLGNDYFKAGDFSAALAHYEKGVEIVRGMDEVPAAVVATLLSNSALCLLKLKWPDRAKKKCSMAVAVVRQAGDESFDQSKLFYRRALASEQLRDFPAAVDDMTRALAQAKRSNLVVVEQNRIEKEIERLKKLRTSDDSNTERRRQEQENERSAALKRMQGAELQAKTKPATSQTAGLAPQVEAPGGGSYLQEQDFTHLATTKIIAAMKNITHRCQSGGRIEVTHLMEEQSKINAAVTTKKGVRALYYDMDLHLAWKGTVAPRLKPADGPGELNGLIRVYNIAHDTKFELGGDGGVCYMYQLGWDQRVSGAWADDLKTEAAELFDLVAARVDEVIAELKQK